VGLEVIVPLAVGIWFAVLLFVISLCRAAKSGDEATNAFRPGATTARLDAELPPLPPANEPLRTLNLYQAAALLKVLPETLLVWEARYGFPTSSPAERLYNQSEVLALRDSLRQEPSIAAAVARARERIKRRRATVRAPVGHHRDGGLAS
jgi:hypothetical protein